MKKLIPFLLLLFALNSFSQKEANIWYFGRNAGVDFNSDPPIALTDGEINTLEGCSSFADAAGNLLFYSDGIKVLSKDHSLMTYTDGSPADNLKGNPSSTQSGMIIPKPGSTSIYYLFTVGNNYNPSFDLYTVDMSLNSNLGQLIDVDSDGDFSEDLAEQAPANKGDWTEKVAAVKGKECNTFWVVTKVANFFYSYKIDQTGVDLTPVISTVNNRTINTRGYLKLSPNGEKIAIVNQNDTNDVVIYSFDNDSGIVSNDGISIFNNFGDGQAYGVEFSRTSEKLYVSSVSGFREDLSGPETTYRLFQFDLKSSDIKASKALIHEQVGYRGALQLGPDGKIYATIPLAYDDPNGDATFLGAIENPNADAADVIFTKEAISLGGQKATQGLPPFISSLLLPIEIKDSGTNEVINDQDLQLCIGDSKGIEPNIPSGNNQTYEWFFNNGTTPIATTPSLLLDNLLKTDSGKYTLIVKLTDACGNTIQYDGTFNMTVFEAASARKPIDINFCDIDTTTPNIFDLEALKNVEILDGLDATIFDVLYFDTLSKATANNTGTDLPKPYEVNTVSVQTIYARVHNKNATNACFAITDFKLEVTSEPEPVQPTVFRLCDDTDSGSDTDGITNNFILNTKDTEILGTLSNLQYKVSYHTTLSDAQTSSTTNAIDKNADYLVTNSKTIFVRVENTDNTNCNAVSNDTVGSSFMSFELIVAPLPIIKTNPVILKQCDDNTDLITTFNLTEAEISISDNRANETFEYYATEAEAIAGSPQVADKLRYPVNGSGEAWVRTISEFTCYRISKLELIVSFAGDVNYNRNFVSCDDFLDTAGNNTATNSDTDGITFFDFSEAEQEILNLFPALIQPNLEVLFYETTADRTAAVNEIPDISMHRNNNDPAYINNQTIFIKIKNKVNNDCTGIGQLSLSVKPVPLANTPASFNLCDDDLSGSTTDGENANIDLRDRVDTILGTTQTEADYIVSFHTSAIGANTNNDVITNDSNFTNAAQASFTSGDISEQIIYVRVQDRNGDPKCFNDHVSFKIIINPIPDISATITPFAVCDIATPSDSDTRNRVAQNIDLTSKDSEILNGKTNHRVAYYVTQQDADDGNEIASPTVFQNITSQTTFPADFNTDEPGIETIFFKILDLGGNKCESVFATFQLLIYPEPNIPINISDYSDCDNTSDIDADDENGRNGDITLKNKIPEILSNYQPSEFNDFSITFYTSLANAEAGDIALAVDENKFENSTNNQPIYVRVENTKNTPIACVHTRLSFNINIKPLPVFTVMGEEGIDAPQIICLNDTPLILEAERTPATYNYEWTNEAGTVLGNTPTLEVTTSGKYSITASDQSPDGCARKRTIVVKESNIATLEESFVTIIDESNTIGSDDNISISIDTQSNNLGPGEYQFAIRNDDNNDRIPFIGFQDAPLFENLEGGIYTIIVNDKNGCSPDTQLQMSVIQFPKFFTPNGDGNNDNWVIKGANKTFYPNSSINIFNRFGKLVAKVPIDGQGWSGTYNGKTLSSDDYWYTIQLIPANTSKPPILKKGHFSLIRR